MSAYVIVDVKVNDPERYENYKKMVPSSLQAYGGKFLVRGGEFEVLEGDWQPNRIVVLEFDSVERARAWHDSPEYREALELRLAATDSKLLIVDGV